MSWVERLGRTRSETVGVGDEGDGGAGVHNDMSTSICNNNNNNNTHLHIAYYTICCYTTAYISIFLLDKCFMNKSFYYQQ